MNTIIAKFSKITENNKKLENSTTEEKQSGFEVKYEKCEMFLPEDTNLSESPATLSTSLQQESDLLCSHIGCPELQERFLEEKNIDSDCPTRNTTNTTRTESQIEFAIRKNWLSVCKINRLLKSLPPIPSHSSLVFDNTNAFAWNAK